MTHLKVWVCRVWDDSGLSNGNVKKRGELQD